MSIREAMMEMYGAKKVKREAWVPEAITDEDAANFMGAAAAAKKAGKSHFDFGGKKYKVTMKHDTAKKVAESAECPTCGEGECQCEQPVEEAKVDEVSYKTAMKSYQKAMGQSKDADTAGDKETGDKKFDQAVKFGRYANKKFQSSRNKKKLVRTLSRQVPLGTLTKEETVEEAAKPTAQHGPDEKTTDTFDKQIGGGRSPREKEFVDMHNTEIALDIEKVTAQNKQSMEDALKQTPPRLGDQRKGDTSFVNPVKADIIDGITKALQQMKTNN